MDINVVIKVVFLILVTSKIEAARYGEHCNVFDSCSDPAQICVGTVCICDAGYIHVIGGCVSTLGCEMKKRLDDTAAADTDYEIAFKSSLINCTSICLRDAKCKAAYYSNGFCFIIYKDAPNLARYTGSSYFDKVCNFTYPSLSVSLSGTPVFAAVSSNTFLTAIITSEVPVEFIIWQRVGADNSTTPLDLTTEKYTQIGNIQQASVTLIINNLTLGDSGTYMVYVKSSAGTTNTSNQVIVSVVEALDCKMKKRPVEVVAADTDYETAFKSSLINCTSICLRDANCKAAYYSNGFCFILYKYTPTLNPYAGSSYFDKVCNPSLSVFLSTTPVFGTVSSKAFLTAIITSEIPVEFIIWQRVEADNSTTPLDLTTEKYIQIGNLEQMSVTLIINNLTHGDSGTYMVYVKSSAGTTNTSNQIIVNVAEGECPRGTHSYNGYTPCRDCPRNYYQDKAGATNCTRCPVTQFTTSTRSTTPMDCLNDKQGQEKTDSIPIVTGGVVSVIVVTIVIVIIITVQKRRLRKEKEANAYAENFHVEYCKDSDETYSAIDHGKQKIERKPVPSALFVHHVTELMRDNKHLLYEEYEELQRRSTEEATTTVAAMTKKNVPKNRGTCIPYDFNRVKLLTVAKNDYINASLLLNESYIITQYPLPTTNSDIWQMVWEQNVSVIVVLNAQSDEKEAWYFPNTEGTARTMRMIELELTAKIKLLNGITVRKIKLMKGKNTKMVCHFHIEDLNIDNFTEKLLTLINIVKENESGFKNVGPQVVHGGSFGIDYSGAYSIVDYIVRSLGKNGNSVDVFESALALLKGRMSTIHSADEYSAIYNCLQQYVQRSFPSSTRDEASTYEYLP
uniref:Receptor-type tyrosine-protein phosphatase eta-like isoform X3 n=1 Tax=Crassostrea virginica TaxID=6565 RepID=A0A8B8AWU3_CRAVI|nr:receptor-type tyrosine-protein phosphatase eta-like isoform X3 [Crassostrea virginica]